MRKIKNGKTAYKVEVTGEMVKSGDDMVVDWIWRLHSIEVVYIQQMHKPLLFP